MHIFLPSFMMMPFWIVLIAWVVLWKLYAVWTAARNSHKIWFVILLLANTFSILDIIYIFYIAKKNMKDIKADVSGIIGKKSSSHSSKEEKEGDK